MTELDIPYVYVEDIESSLDVKPSAFMQREILRACRTGSRMVDAFCHRILYPHFDTITFDYPGSRATSQAIWLDQNELVSASAIVSDTVTIPADTGYLLRPSDGPPYNRIELNRDSSYAFAGGPQDAVSVTGLYGFRDDEATESALTDAIASSAATTLTVDRPVGGIGSLLRIDTERLFLASKNWVASAATAPALAADRAVVGVTVASGSVFTAGEVILIDSERMEIVDIAGNLLTVRRGVGGSVLAAHTLGATIYWQHSLTVTRGAVGSTAAAHADASVVYRWEPPSEARDLAQAYAEDVLLQRNAGYARTSGQGENERPVSGRGITALEGRVKANLARSARKRAV